MNYARSENKKTCRLFISSAFGLHIHSGLYPGLITGNEQEPVPIIIGNFPRYLCQLLQNIDILKKNFMSLYPAPEDSGFYGHVDKTAIFKCDICLIAPRACLSLKYYGAQYYD